MLTFSYKALKRDGGVEDGEISARDRTAAMRQLSRKGLQPVALKPASPGTGAAKPTPKPPPPPKPNSKPGPETRQEPGPEKKPARLRREPRPQKPPKPEPRASSPTVPQGKLKLSRNQLVIFTEELADLLAAGLQLEQALANMERRKEKSAIRDVSQRLREQIREGASFSNALRTTSSSFSDLFCSLAAAGEASGALPKILRRQSEYLIKLQELQGKVAAAMIYPSFLLVAGIAVFVFFVGFLLPELTSLLEETGGTLPVAAVILQRIYGLFVNYWWLFLTLAVAAVVGWKSWIKNTENRTKWHKKIMEIPVLGTVLATRFFVQLLETLGNLVSNGLPLLKGLELTRNATPNLFLRRQMDRVIDLVGEGGSLSNTMKRVGGFPDSLIDMIAVGESTGRMGPTLEKAADRYNRELDKNMQKMTALMQPVVILIMAVVIGAMAYLMVTVIFQTIQNFQGP